MIWIVVATGLLIAGFGATAGAALITVSRAELTRAVGRRLRGATPTMGWLSQVDADLTAASATTSLGVLIVGAALPALLAGSGTRLLTALVALVGVPLVLLAAYLVPRWLTLPRAQGVAVWVMPVLRPWSRVLGLLLPARTAKRPTDLRAIWREGAAVGLRADDELVMVGGVMAFSVRPVREVMTPRTDIVAVDEDADLDDIRAVFAQSGYSRIPVYRDTLDEIVGMLHAFDLFKLRPGDPLPVRPVAMTPASRTCGDLLLDMQRERRHLAVVLDEFGGTQGIVTLEDLLEELVGEIFDEHDEEIRVEPPGGPTIFETDGNLPPEALEERFGVTLPRGRSTTVAGMVVEWAGRIPNPGERFIVRGLEIDVIEASPTRIERLIVRSTETPALTLPAGTGP
ncbi:MAG TPA: hemolysin family protein [Gemmatimonadales bacterium]|nr:hemolysin family protein [Gemmatimonadales bacterium]